MHGTEFGRSIVGSALLGALALGCGGTVDRQGSKAAATLEFPGLGDWYELAFVPTPSFGEFAAARRSVLSDEEIAARFEVELSRRATTATAGALLIPLYDPATGEPVLGTDAARTQLRSTCGATFISPSVVVTAAHCVGVPAVGDPPSRSLTLEMLRPTPGLVDTWTKAAVLTGEFPEFEHEPLTELDGYYVDRHSCELVVRCNPAARGPRFRCDVEETGPYQDVALLRCEGAPGLKYGFLRAAPEVVPGSEVYMPWALERYATTSDEVVDHYVTLEAPNEADLYAHWRKNFHYSGGDENQLLPLEPSDGPDYLPARVHIVGAELNPVAATNLYGCHGTSGASILQYSPGRAFELLGPASGGGIIGRFLCGYEGEEPQEGGLLPDTALPAVLAGLTELGDDCMRVLEPADDSVPALFASTDPCVSRFGTLPIAPDSVPSPIDSSREPGFAMDSTATVTLPWALRAGRAYRVGMAARCDAAPCGAAVISFGDETVLEAIPDDDMPAFSFAARFEPGADGRLLLSATGEVVVSRLAVQAEGQANGFDWASERAEAALFVLQHPRPSPLPMRTTGDGVAGYAALLEENERLAFTRQALPPGRRWSIRIEASSTVGLRCGFLDDAAAVALDAPCDHEDIELDDRASSAARAAFFVQTGAESPRIEIGSVGLTSR